MVQTACGVRSPANDLNNARYIMRISFLFALTLALPQAAAADDLQARAIALFEALQTEGQCPTYLQDRAAPTRRQFTVQGPEGDQPVTTFEFTCDAGAYNLVQTFLIHTDSDGLRPLSFAMPVARMPETSESGGEPLAESGAGIQISGYRTAPTLINASVDDITGRIVTTEKWRGLGDAGASGTWDLTAAGYVLRRYQIDATYDGQVDPVIVLDLRGAVAAE